MSVHGSTPLAGRPTTRGRATGRTRALGRVSWLGLLSWLGLSTLLGGCGGDGDGSQQTLTIVEPEDGVRFTKNDDVDPAKPGFQTDVVVQTTGVSSEAEITLHVLDPDAPGAPPVAKGSPNTEGKATLRATLKPGSFDLEARISATSLVSAQVRYTAPDLGGAADCPVASFVKPAPPAEGALVRSLGPAQDVSGGPCGVSFGSEVRASTDAPEGTDARLIVNGSLGAMAKVASGEVVFDRALLPNRGSTANWLEIEFDVLDASGEQCPAVPYPGEVLVDCEGPSCKITGPMVASGGFLNATHDASMDEGFQLEVVVTTDAAAPTEPVRLVVDGDTGGALSMAAVVSGEQATATFAGVVLEQGAHTVVAECQDELGNPSRSPAMRWTVDSIACGLSLEAPQMGATLTRRDDLNPDVAGVQVKLEGRVSGQGCVRQRAGACTSIENASFGSHDGSAQLIQEVTVTAAGEQQLCLQIADEAGNVTRTEVQVEHRTDLPRLRFATPQADARHFNAAGNSHQGQEYVADLNPSTPACDVRFEVLCSELGEPVRLATEAGTELPGAVASCNGESGLPMGYLGRATFASLALPLSTAASVSLVAHQRTTDQKLEGLSEPLTLMHDCQAPSVAIVEPAGMPLCTTLQGGMTGSDLRRNVRVSSASADLRLEVFRRGAAGASTPVFVDTDPRPIGSNQYLFDVPFQNGGAFVVLATARDAFGNAGVSPGCDVQVPDLPTLTVTQPTAGGVYSAADNCGSGGEFALPVQATTDAVVGSPVTLQIAGGASLGTSVTAGGQIRACVPSVQGSVDLTVRVMDNAKGGATALQTLPLTIDSLTPPHAITDLSLLDPQTTPTTADDNPRHGKVRLSWTAVDDASPGQALVSYELRCVAAPAQITDEASWSQAEPFVVDARPRAGGAVQSANVSGFRIATPVNCTLRGADIVGQMTPLPQATDPGYNLPVELSFRTHQVTAANSVRLGLNMARVGDVNGDGADDLLLGGNGTAHLYFGTSTASLSPTPDVSFTGSADRFDFSAGAFGEAVAGLGDFNGDGCPDFAIGEGAGLGFNKAVGMGRTYVFFGRDNDSTRPCPDTWPTSIDAVKGCGVAGEVDVCLVSGERNAMLGRRVAGPGDFDGDGLADLAVSAPLARAEALGRGAEDGRVYVILGRRHVASGSRMIVPKTLSTSAWEEPDGFVLFDAALYHLGDMLAGLGDTNGDSKADLLFGSTTRSRSTQWALYTLTGRARSGSGLQPIAASAWATQAVGRTPRHFSPSRAEPVGDVDGDGRLDLAVTTVNTSQTGGWQRMPDPAHPNDPSKGMWVWVTVHLAPAGQVQIWPGDGKGNFKRDQAIAMDHPGQDYDYFGISLASSTLTATADIDGDGLADPFIGASALEEPPGAGLFFYGDDSMTKAMSGPLTTADASLVVRLDPASERLIWNQWEDYQNQWRFVQYAGDVNGDGFPDLALADPKGAAGVGTVTLLY